MEDPGEVFVHGEPCSRRASQGLSPLVRTAAAIGEAEESGGSYVGQIALPNQLLTPAGTPAGPRPPSRQGLRGRSFSAASLASEGVTDSKYIEVPYVFTLLDLNPRSYYLLHKDPLLAPPSGPPATPAPGPPGAALPEPLARLHRAAGRLALLANAELCLVRSCQLAGQPPGACRVNLLRPAACELAAAAPTATQATGPGDKGADARGWSPGEEHGLGGASPAAGRRGQASVSGRRAKAARKLAEEHDAAVAPVRELLEANGGALSHHRVKHLLRAERRAAEAALVSAASSGALAACEPGALEALANLFAAYQPAVLDEQAKGSCSPYDSRTRTIEDVQRIVDDGRAARAGEAEGPAQLTRLAGSLLRTAAACRRGFPMAAWLLQAACLSGQSELAGVLLATPGSGLRESTAIRALRNAWYGYRAYGRFRPLQAGRERCHSVDWLDFKYSTPRAVLIAHRVLTMLINVTDAEAGAARLYASGMTALAGSVAEPYFMGAPTLKRPTLHMAGTVAMAAAAVAAEAAAAEEAAGEGTGDDSWAIPATVEGRTSDAAAVGRTPTSLRVAAGGRSVKFKVAPFDPGAAQEQQQESGQSDSQVSEGVAAASAALEVSYQGWVAKASTGTAAEGGSAEAVDGAGAPGAVTAVPVRAGFGGGEEELTASKWEVVQLLFERPAACKPLSLAMMHHVLAGRRAIRAAMEAEDAAARASTAVAAAAAAVADSVEGDGEDDMDGDLGAGAGEGADEVGPDGDNGGGDRVGKAPCTPTTPTLVRAHSADLFLRHSAAATATAAAALDDDGDDGGASESAAVTPRARAAEAREASRYRPLHRLAVQAAHLAVHGGGLAGVADALRCIRAVRAWPALDLVLLNDLADRFPGQAAELLALVPLEEVELEDNVLPFGLPAGFITVAVSDRDTREFRGEGGTGSTQDATHFATQTEADTSIEASLLVQGRVWMALAFLFWPSEMRSPTSRQMLRVARCAAAAFARQGPGSAAVAAACGLLLAVAAVAVRLAVAAVRIAYWGVLYRLWCTSVGRFPALRRFLNTLRGRREGRGGRPNGGGGGGGRVAASPAGAASAAVAASVASSIMLGPPGPGQSVVAFGAAKGAAPEEEGGGEEGGEGSEAGSEVSTDELGAAFALPSLAGLQGLAGLAGLNGSLGRGLWRRLLASGHNAVIDGAVGWGLNSASICCRKVPFQVGFAARAALPQRPPPPQQQQPQPPQPPQPPGSSLRLQQLSPASPTPQQAQAQAPRRSAPASAAAAAAPGPAPPPEQLDTALLEKLLNAPGLHPRVFGTPVLRAFILFKWNYFTKYFIILQLLLHLTYMAVFLAYAFTIKDMQPAGTGSCQLAKPTPAQTGLLAALALMSADFAVQEFRQLRHFGLHYFTHTWDLLDLASLALVVASIALHASCAPGVGPGTLRGLASVQIVLLFMRLLYYAMASDKLGSFVRMVLETTYDLLLFFVFLSVIFVGFALAIIVAQGTLADEEQTFIKLFTMMYGDFDVSYLSSLESGALGLDALTRVLASVYMIMVTIILLNLLISVISESYERIRENERWESLRNKALLVVESETQLTRAFLAWLYRTLCPPSEPSGPAGGGGDGGGGLGADSGRRFLYVIAPEYARRVSPDTAEEEDEEGEEEGEDANEDDSPDGQWNGRLGEIKLQIAAQGRATVDGVRRELGRMLGLGGGRTRGSVAKWRGAAVGGEAREEAVEEAEERARRAVEGAVEGAVARHVGELRAEVAALRQLLAAAAAGAGGAQRGGGSGGEQGDAGWPQWGAARHGPLRPDTAPAWADGAPPPPQQLQAPPPALPRPPAAGRGPSRGHVVSGSATARGREEAAAAPPAAAGELLQRDSLSHAPPSELHGLVQGGDEQPTLRRGPGQGQGQAQEEGSREEVEVVASESPRISDTGHV